MNWKIGDKVQDTEHMDIGEVSKVLKTVIYIRFPDNDQGLITDVKYKLNSREDMGNIRKLTKLERALS